TFEQQLGARRGGRRNTGGLRQRRRGDRDASVAHGALLVPPRGDERSAWTKRLLPKPNGGGSRAAARRPVRRRFVRSPRPVQTIISWAGLSSANEILERWCHRFLWLDRALLSKFAAMPRRLPPLNTLRSFEAAARYESFTRAAEELHVTQSA